MWPTLPSGASLRLLVGPEIPIKAPVQLSWDCVTYLSKKSSADWRHVGQAKPEIDDYVSFVGFFVHYMDGLRQSASHSPSERIFEPTLSPIQSACNTFSEPNATATQGTKLVLGGYSYGALITMQLPTLEVILKRFQSVAKGTAEAEARLRAVSLAAQWSKDADLHHEKRQARRTGSCEKIRNSARSMAVAMGGDESEPSSRRHSHDSRRSLEAVRRSVERGRRKFGLKRHYDDMSEEALIEESLTSMNVPTPQIHYLLISPPLPLVTALITMFSSLIRMNTPYSEEKICSSPTLMIYGDRDFFTSQKRYRKWAEVLAAKPGSRFQFREVTGAGHFYRENGVDTEMRSCIRDWIQTVCHGPALGD